MRRTMRLGLGLGLLLFAALAAKGASLGGDEGGSLNPTPAPAQTAPAETPAAPQAEPKKEETPTREIAPAPAASAPASPSTATASSQNVDKTLAPAAASTLAVTDSTGDILKSPVDDRLYRYLTLENGLTALLVSDPKGPKGAAAMDVGTGYWHDPDDLPGLAHFCEHMLFLGTKKYPDEDSYTAYLSSHGGSSNAFTATENTNFYFDVEPDAFEEALDRFASFFTGPLFTQSASGREVNAVESEHAKNLQSDVWRHFQLIQSLAVPTHPFHKFGTGSSDTLGKFTDTQLREALLKFYQQWYVASNMRLVVLGRQDLDTLEKWVRAKFVEVPSDAAKTPVKFNETDTSATVFPAEVLGSMVHIQSIKDHDVLMLMWLLPPQSSKFKQKSMEYISTLLGNEAKGSLLSQLRRRGWAQALSAGPDMSTGNFELFQVEISLTEKATDPAVTQQVIETVMSYLYLIEAEGVAEWRWHEMGEINRLQFRLKNKEEAQSYVSSLSGDMFKYPARELLAADYMYAEYNKDEILALLKRMQPSAMLALVSSKRPTVNLTESEKWYGTKYRLDKFDTAFSTKLEAARSSLAGVPAEYQLLLPEKNPFIPTDLNMKAPVVNERDPNTPYIISDVRDELSPDRGSTRVWFKQDLRFSRPRANVICKFWTQRAYTSPRDVVLSSLYTKMVQDAAGDVAYPANTAGFDFSLSNDVDGLDLHISGYNSGLLEFVKTIADYLVVADERRLGADKKLAHGFIPTQDRFDALKEELMHSYINFMYGQPHTHASYALSLLLEQPHWHITQYQAALLRVDLVDLVEWAHSFWEDVGLECLAHGNLDEADALALVKAITDVVPFRSVSQASRLVSTQVQRISRLNGEYTLYGNAPNPQDRNSAIYTYFQGGMSSLEDDVRVDLVSMVMDKPAFHQLRTVEQLGYIVWSGVDARENVNGIRIIVQSPKYDGRYLAKRVDAFIGMFRDLVQSMNSTEFKVFVDTLITMKEEKPNALSDETSRFWVEITTQQYLFDRRQRQVAVLKNQTVEGFRAYFDELIGYGQPAANRVNVEINAVTPPPSEAHVPSHGEYAGSVPVQYGGPVTEYAGTTEYGGVPQEYGQHPTEYATPVDRSESPAVPPGSSGVVKEETIEAPKHAAFIELTGAGSVSPVMLYPAAEAGSVVHTVSTTTEISGSSSNSVVQPTTPVAVTVLAPHPPQTPHTGTSCPCVARPCYCTTHPCCHALPPPPPPQPKEVTKVEFADSCNYNGKAPRVFDPIPISLENIERAKDTLCLFPQEPVRPVDSFYKVAATMMLLKTPSDGTLPTNVPGAPNIDKNPLQAK